MKLAAKIPPIQQVIEEVLRSLGLSNFRVIIEASSIPGHVSYTVTGDDTALLIGRNGRNLEALSKLVREIVVSRSATFNAHFETQNYIIDVGGYQDLEIKRLLASIEDKIQQSASNQNMIELEPMPSFQRRVVHAYVQNKPGFESESRGVGRDRRVIIRS